MIGGRSKAATLAAASLLAMFVQRSNASIYFDDFSGDTAGVQPSGWFTATGSPTTFTTAVDSVSGNVTNQNAMQVATASTANRFQVANFTTTTLTNVGDEIILTMKVRDTDSTFAVANRAISFGLFNSNGSPITSNLTSSTIFSTTPGHPGYTGSFDLGTAGLSNDFQIGKTIGGASNTLLASTAPTGSSGKEASSHSTLNDNNQHTLILAIQMTATGITGTATFDHALDGSIVAEDSSSPPGALVTGADASPILTFNEISFGTKAATGYYIDSAQVDFVAVPEPGVLGLVGIGAFGLLMHRRRLAV